MLLSWETLSSSVVSLDQLPFFFAGWKLLISLVCVAHLGFGVLGGGNRICDGEVTWRSQFLKPYLAVLWIMFSALTTAPAWRGQKLERKGQTGPGTGPLWLEGKAKLRHCYLSALTLEVKRQVRCEQHRTPQHALPSALLFSSPALQPEKPSALGGYTVSHPKMWLRCDCRVFSAFPEPSSLSVGADGTRLIKLASTVLTSAAVTRGSQRVCREGAKAAEGVQGMIHLFLNWMSKIGLESCAREVPIPLRWLWKELTVISSTSLLSISVSSRMNPTQMAFGCVCTQSSAQGGRILSHRGCYRI